MKPTKAFEQVGIGDNYDIVEDANGDLVAKDQNGNEVLKYDHEGGEWVLPALAAEEGTITSISGSDLEYKSVNDFYFASNYDGANGWEQIQAAIDAANSESGNNAVVVGPVGPDTDQKWIGNSPIDLYDNTTLILQGCHLLQESGSNTRIFRNSDQTNGNSNITIVSEGGIIDGNAENASRTESLSALTLDFYKVSDLTIEGSLTVKNTVAWAVKFEECDGAEAEHLRFEQNGAYGNQDGLKCIGSSQLSVDRITGDTQDDPFSTNTDDARKFMHGTGGSYEDVSVGTIRVTGANNRLLIAKTDHDTAGYTAKNVNVDTVIIEGEAINTAIKIGGNNDSAEFKDITIGDVHCRNVDFAILFQEVGVEDVEIGRLNCDVGRYAVQVSDSITVDNVRFKGGHIVGPGSSDSPFRVESGSTINGWQFDGLHCEDFEFMFDFLGTANDCYADNIHIDNISKPYTRAGGIRLGDNVPPTATGTFTHAGGGGATTETATGNKFAVAGDAVEYQTDIQPDPDASDFDGADYAWYVDRVINMWDNSTSNVVPKIVVGWDTDPGSGNDVTFEYEVKPKVIA